MGPYGMTGLAQGINTGIEEATRGIIQGLDYKNRQEDRADNKITDAESARQQLEQYNLKLEQQKLELEDLKSTIAKKETYEGFSAYSETNDPRYLTELLKNPTIKKALPGALRYDNINPIDDKALMEPLGLTEELLNKDPTRYVKATTDDGSVHIVDMYGAYAKTGYHKVARQEVLDKMKSSIEVAKGTQALGEAEVTLKAFNTGKPEEVLKALSLTDPELFLKLKQGGSVHMDAYTQAVTAFRAGNPNPTPEQWQSFNKAYATKTVAGVGYNAENLNVEDLSGNRAVARTLFTPEGASKPLGKWKVDARNTQDTILSNMDEKEKTTVMKAQETLETNHQTASMVENLLKGDFTKVDKDVIANAKTWLLSNTGIENKQAIANMNFNTQSGMMLAGLIKEMSGTAAADAEVSRLMTNFLGGNFTDERYIKETMKSFSSYLRTKNNTLGKMYKDSIPYTVGTTTNLKPKSQQPVKPVGGNKGTMSGPNQSNLPPLVFPGKPSTSVGGKPSLKEFHPTKGSKKPSLDSFGTGAYK